jgi:hypothetical protein
MNGNICNTTLCDCLTCIPAMTTSVSIGVGSWLNIIWAALNIIVTIVTICLQIYTNKKMVTRNVLINTLSTLMPIGRPKIVELEDSLPQVQSLSPSLQHPSISVSDSKSNQNAKSLV